MEDYYRIDIYVTLAQSLSLNAYTFTACLLVCKMRMFKYSLG